MNTEYKEAGTGATGDDADSTDQVIGSKAVIHGLSIDSIGRSNPMNTIPAKVRRELLAFLAGDIPLYSDDYSVDGTTGDIIFGDSLATRLEVTVKDAEDYSISPTTSAFKEYADMPLNKEVNDRLSFFKYNPLAAELDQFLKLEPQKYAVDSLSQLVSEAFAYHFDFLNTLDVEYHRLRDHGPLGEFNDSGEREAWFNLYHLHRAAVKAAYLDTGLVTLPVGLENANWRIQDVLTEIIHKWAPNGTDLRDDVILTLQGILKGKQGASLGIYPAGSGYEDNDGNPRFYMPRYKEGFSTTSLGGTPVRVSGTITSLGDNSILSSGFKGTPEGVYSPTASTFAFGYDDSPLQFIKKCIDIMNRDETQMALPAALATYTEGAALPWTINSDTLSHYYYSPDCVEILRLPGATGGTGTVAALATTDALPLVTTSEGNQVALWRGYHLNLVDLLELTTKMGRQLEPEAIDFMGRFGIMGSIDQLATKTQGLGARSYDDLINLYAANFSYNENPARVYTAAHLGPINDVLDPANGTAITLEGNELKSTDKAGNPLTVRQRYWTPQSLTPEEAQKVLNAYLPGTDMEMGLMNKVSFGSTGSGLKLVTEGFIHPELIAALFTTDDSMRTKVEKNVVLRATIPEEEATYASGIGVGSTQLITELQLNAVGGHMDIGLGHNGFVDIKMDGNDVFTRSLSGENRSAKTGLSFGEKRNGTPSPAQPQTHALSPVHRLLLNEAADYVDANIDDGWHNFFMDGGPHIDTILAKLNSAVIPRSEKLQAQLSEGLSTPDVVASAHLHPGSGGAAVLNPRISMSDMLVHDQWGLLEFATDLATPLWDAVKMHTDCPAGTGIAVFPKSVRFAVTDESGNQSTVTVDVGPQTTGTSTQEAFDPINLDVDNDMKAGLSRLINALGNYQIGIHQGQLLGPGNNAWSDGSRLGSRIGRYAYNAEPVDVMVSALNTVLHRHMDNPEIHGLPLIEDSEFGGYKVSMTFEVLATAFEISSNPTSAISRGEQIGRSTQTWELHFAEAADGLDQKSALLAEGMRQFGIWQNGADTGLDIRGTWSPVLGQQYDVSFDHKVSAVAAARFVGQTNFYQRTTASSTYVNWSQTTDIVGIKPPVQDGGFVGSIVSVFSADPTQRGVRATGEFADIKVNVQNSLDPALLRALAFRPGSFASGGEYSPGDETALVNQGGATIAEIVGGAVASYLSYSQGGLNYSLQPDRLFGADYADTKGISDSIHSGTVGVTTGQYGAVNNGATYQNTGALFSQVNIASSDGSDAVWIIPDKPENRMLYRPHRNLVDAALAAELKLLLIPTSERLDSDGGILGLPYYGENSEFRFHQLVKAGQVQQYVLEKQTSATRLIDTSSRGRLSFSKVSLMDQNTQRSILPDVVRQLDQVKTTRRNALMSDVSGNMVIDVPTIRAIQSGRQTQRMSRK